MKIAKRTLLVSKKKLEELFSLPEGVEVLSVTPTNNGWEFLLASAGEVIIGDKVITIVQEDEYIGNYRRISLGTLEEVKNLKN